MLAHREPLGDDVSRRLRARLTLRFTWASVSNEAWVRRLHRFGASVRDGGHPHRDQHSRQFHAELGDVTRGRCFRKPGRVFLVHTREVRRVREEDANLDDIMQRRVGRVQDGFAVRERLSGLFGDG
jgi:hypothetical protein